MKFKIIQMGWLLKSLIIVACLFGPGLVFAETFQVTRVDDPVPDGCNPLDCSLREAISSANSNAVADTIQLDSAGFGVFIIEQPSVDDHNFGGDLDIRGFGSLTTINGAPGGSTINGTGAERVFHLISGSQLELNDIDITGVSSISEGAVNVQALSTLTMYRSNIFSNSNSAFGGAGGLFNAGNASLIDTAVAANTAGKAGGIYNSGYLLLERSTVSNNAADGNVGAGWGGGIYNSGILDIVNSTLSGNFSQDTGGAIFNDGFLDLKNVTFAQNGGPSGSGSATLTIHQPNWGGQTAMQNTLADFGDCNEFGSFVSWGNNFGFGITGECGSGAGDVAGTPVLGPLAYNGGFTPTHVIPENSLAIDAAADLSAEFTVDQRGVNRPQRTGWDIGAYEREPLSTTVIVVNTTVHGNDVFQGDGICEKTTGVGDCSLAAAVQEATAAGIEHISLPAGTYAQIAGFHITAPITLTGAGSATTIIDGQGVVSKFFVLTESADFNLSGVTIRNADTEALQVAAGKVANLTDVKITGINSANGNGIDNAGTLTLNNCLLDANGNGGDYGAINNRAGGQLDFIDSQISNSVGSGLINAGTAALLRATINNNTGGAGINSSGTVSIIDSTVEMNDLAGIKNTGATTIIRTTIQSNAAGGINAINGASIMDSKIVDNSASNAATAISGSNLNISGTEITGNTENSPAQVPTIMLNSGVNNISSTTISSNTSYYGGIFLNAGATLNLSNSTISGNAGVLSGAIFNTGDSYLNNVTIANNVGNGGLHKGDGGGSITMGNSILYNNKNTSGSAVNCNIWPLVITSLGYNISSDNSCAPLGSNDLSNTNPLLGALASNGGLTQTHSLTAGSPAIDGGDPASGCEQNDQRGIQRPLDGDGDLTATCDVGAFEADAIASPVADAGADQTAESVIETIALGGVPSASNGNPPYTYEWSLVPGIAGTDYELSSFTSANPEFTGLVDTVYTATLTVTDSKSAQHSDSATISVETPIPPLMADAGADGAIITGTETLILGGSPAATGGTPSYAYAWNVTPGIAGTDYTLSSATEANPTFTGLTAGTYTVELTVTDNDSAQHVDSAVIEVTIPDTRQVQGALDGSLSLGACQNIVVQQGSTVLAGANIELLAPAVSFETEFSVQANAVLKVVSGLPDECVAP